MNVDDLQAVLKATPLPDVGKPWTRAATIEMAVRKGVEVFFSKEESLCYASWWLTQIDPPASSAELHAIRQIIEARVAVERRRRGDLDSPIQQNSHTEIKPLKNESAGYIQTSNNQTNASDIPFSEFNRHLGVSDDWRPWHVCGYCGREGCTHPH